LTSSKFGDMRAAAGVNRRPHVLVAIPPLVVLTPTLVVISVVFPLKEMLVTFRPKPIGFVPIAPFMPGVLAIPVSVGVTERDAVMADLDAHLCVLSYRRQSRRQQPAGHGEGDKRYLDSHAKFSSVLQPRGHDEPIDTDRQKPTQKSVTRFRRGGEP
jgi:hypothetical protein